MSSDRNVAFVTGASYGLGFEIALAFARAGYDVAVSARSRDRLGRISQALESVGARPIPIVLDLASQESAEAAITALFESARRITTLVNNAAVTARGSASAISRDEWNALIRVNLTGTFFLTQIFGRRLIQADAPGSIVNISSTHGIVAARERLAYGVSKAALNHLTKTLALEWADHRIRVNAVAPGRVLTDSPARAATASDPQYIEAMLQRIPLRRMVTPQEVAAAVVYLANPLAASITGQTLVLDGGLTLG